MSRISAQVARVVVLLLVATAALAPSALAQRCAPGPCSFVDIPTSGIPAIAVGPNNSLAIATSDLMGFVSPAGVLARSSSPDGSANGVAAGPDGAVWVAGASTATRIAPDGQRLEVRLHKARHLVVIPGVPSVPDQEYLAALGPLVVSADGAAWLATAGGVTRIGVDGSQSYLDLGGSGTGVEGLAAAPDGAVWATVLDVKGTGSKRVNRMLVDRIAPDGSVASWPLTASFAPRYESHLGGLVVGPDGGVWFAGTSAGVLGRIGPDGAFSTIDVDGYPTDVTVGPGNTIWFSTWNGIDRGWVGRMSLGGFITLFDQPAAPMRIVASGGTVWTAMARGLGRIQTFEGLVVTRRRVARLTHTGGTVYPRVYCPAFTQGYCAGRLTIRAGRRTIGSAPFAVRPNDAPSVRVPLARSAIATVNRRRRLVVTVVAHTRDGAGQLRDTSGTITLMPA